MIPLLLSCALASAAPSEEPGPVAGSSLYFVVNALAVTADHGAVGASPESVLGTLFDTNLAHFRPAVDDTAVKVRASPELACLLGDEDADGDFWSIPFGDVDALAVRRYKASPPVRPGWDSLILSCQDAWADADEPNAADGRGAVDGSLFSVRRDGPATDYEVDFLLTEADLRIALGPPLDPDATFDVDVDALVQDTLGNLYLSFRSGEWVDGVWLDDGGVACLPRPCLWYDAAGRVTSLLPGCARIVLHESTVDAFVVNADLRRQSGTAIQAVGDLQALEFDPAGGTTEAAESVTGLGPFIPNLLFNGSALGPSVLTTADGGRIATLDGMPLATSPIHGGPLGLDPALTDAPTHDLNALLVLPAASPAPCLDVDAGEIDAAAGAAAAVVVGNVTPSSGVVLLVTGSVPLPGSVAPSVPAPGALGYPDLYVYAPLWSCVLQTDGEGRARLEASVATLASAPPLWMVMQVFDPAAGELSPPAGIWVP